MTHEAVFERWLTLPRTWCARFVKNREEAALVVALARAGVSLDLLLHYRRKQKDDARMLQHVAGVLYRRVNATAVGTSLSACLPLAAQAHQQSRVCNAVLCSRLAQLAELLRSLQQQLHQWVAVNSSVADELIAHKNLALQKRVLADAEAQLVHKVEQLLRRLPQAAPGLSMMQQQDPTGAFSSDQVWSSLESQRREVLAQIPRPGCVHTCAKGTTPFADGESNFGIAHFAQAEDVPQFDERQSNVEGACAPHVAPGRKRPCDASEKFVQQGAPLSRRRSSSLHLQSSQSSASSTSPSPSRVPVVAVDAVAADGSATAFEDSQAHAKIHLVRNRSQQSDDPDDGFEDAASEQVVLSSQIPV